VSTPFLPYLSLSGTSMASPVVAGTVALMLQANPSLTPNAVKAILQYTSQSYAGYDVLTQGAGFLNAMGAVRLARFFATAQPGDTVPVQAMWSKHIVWGNHLLSGGLILPDANAWHPGVVWGAAQADNGDNIVWGSGCATDGCDNIVWGSVLADNIVWGSSTASDTTWADTAQVAAAATSTGPTLDQMTDEQLIALLIQMVSDPPSLTTADGGGTSAPVSTTTPGDGGVTMTTTTGVAPSLSTAPSLPTIPGGGF